MSTEPTLPRRRLGLFDVLCLGVNATVGSGVFSLPDDMHRAMGGWSPFAYVLCTLLLLPVALCFAELSGRFEETGGAFVYARHAFGDPRPHLMLDQVVKVWRMKRVGGTHRALRIAPRWAFSRRRERPEFVLGRAEQLPEGEHGRTRNRVAE